MCRQDPGIKRWRVMSIWRACSPSSVHVVVSESGCGSSAVGVAVSPRQSAWRCPQAWHEFTPAPPAPAPPATSWPSETAGVWSCRGCGNQATSLFERECCEAVVRGSRLPRCPRRGVHGVPTAVGTASHYCFARRLTRSGAAFPAVYEQQ
ncbi:hypothetical protein CC85DRAFT_86520 [Cutaneotrichosporon oleaginosum]|uniref:Uncharacterized protein n=1 Tax=Cutaneotrichosporon oleaginosum TaxID=879819 RepID=A0A0J0XXQ9_9TREE|nr:uncharacterized protein CC85DRAFT_86520 [Cutaneotrichosporon oleaginosum]KLT45828.1 hypothetical protein CC85DRAFT_86520 [Cutaneotrichosporon oleaginosum]TXT06534.1 hypothetical protein COLE_05865 [Cutaneotrichosporon oleaginosum]